MEINHRDRAEELKYRVCAVFKKELKSLERKRTYPLAYLRGMMYLTLWKEGCSASEIARLFGKNHATVFYWLMRTDDMIKFNKPIKELYYKYRYIETDYE